MIDNLLIQAAQNLFSINIIDNPYVVINAVVNDNLLSKISGKRRYLTTSGILGGSGLNLVKHDIPNFKPVPLGFEALNIKYPDTDLGMVDIVGAYSGWDTVEIVKHNVYCIEKFSFWSNKYTYITSISENEYYVITRGLVFYIRLKQDHLTLKYNMPYKKVRNNIKGLYE